MKPVITNTVPRIGYQGEPGAFSEMAARRFFSGDLKMVPCATFDQLFTAFRTEEVDFIIAPVENSIAGKVERVHSLLQTTPHEFVNEMELPIIQSLIVLPGTKLDDVRTAESHPVALAQCGKFFTKHRGIRPVESNDTAASVRRIMEASDPSRAAVASSVAAERYGAVVLITGIQDDANNRTRFQLLKRKTGETQ